MKHFKFGILFLLLIQLFACGDRDPDDEATHPTVIATAPPLGATDVAINTVVVATFSKVMDAETISDTTFVVRQGTEVVAGRVSYADLDAVFTPDEPLASNVETVATITRAATDLAGNSMEEPYIWSFTTGAVPDTLAPFVVSTTPFDGATGVDPSVIITGTFGEALNPSTVSNSTVNVVSNGSPVPGTVSYARNTVTFSPAAPLDESATYTVTFDNAIADLAGNTIVADYVWTFTTGDAQGLVLAPVNLGSLSTFVAVAGAGLTNSNSSGSTTLNGDVGLTPAATCMGDGAPCTALNPVINGTLYANDPEGVAAQAKVELVAASADAMSRPPGTTVNDISGMVLTPGVYTSASTMSVAVGGTVTLDGQGDANSVFIFQVGSSLTVNNNASVVLINGAKAANVFWAVFASSTLGANVDFSGNILAGASNSVGTDSVVLGRLLCTTGKITLLSNVITLPPL